MEMVPARRIIIMWQGSAESEKMVILYDEDGKGIVPAANAFVEKVLPSVARSSCCLLHLRGSF